MVGSASACQGPSPKQRKLGSSTIEAGDGDHRVHAEVVLYRTLCSRLFCVGIRRHLHNAEKQRTWQITTGASGQYPIHSQRGA